MVLEKTSPLGPLPYGWKLVPLADLTLKIGSGATPLGGDAVYLEARDKYALIHSQNVYDRRFDSQNLAFISDQDAHRLDGVKVRPRDILLNITGDGITFARACMVEETILPARVNQHVSIIRAKEDLLDPGFLFSYLTHPQIKYYMESFNAGGSRRALTKGHIESFQIPLPPINEQRAIAHILGSLDDKIEANRRMNETLEAMARTLFKSWFVDFDPVRARAEGRAPAGMGAETAALFPDSFEEQEGRIVPRGWRVGRVSDLCSAIYSGGTPSTDRPEYWNGEISWLSSGETREKFIIGTKRQITTAGVSNSSARLALSRSTVIASAGQGNTRGQTSMLTIDCYINQSVVALVAKPEISSQYHLFFDLERRYEEFRRISDAHSSRGSLTTKLLAGLNAMMPEHSVIHCFDDVVGAMIERVIGNLQESHTLAALRDSLLPKFISGEMCINDAKTLLL